jgi:hypothetical protein
MQLAQKFQLIAKLTQGMKLDLIQIQDSFLMHIYNAVFYRKIQILARKAITLQKHS